jgi:stage V sporulation protein G
LQAFCSITFDDCFVVRDLKIIEGTSGPFVAMPSRKLTSHCPQCGAKNHLRANHCNDCGYRLNPNRAPLDEDGRAKLYADIAHPINSACREMIQDRVIREFREEQERAKLPGYVSRYDDFDIDDVPPQRHSRGPSRGHPTTSYVRPGSERSPHVPLAQPTPRAANKPAKPQRSLSAGQTSHDGSADGKPPSGDSSPAVKPDSDNFGAGIF